MLGWRLAISALLIPAFIALCWIDHRLGGAAPVLFVLTLLLGLRCSWEMVGLLRPRFSEVRFTPCAVCIVALLLSAWAPHWVSAGETSQSALGAIGVAFSLCVLLLMAIEAVRFRQPGHRMETLAAHLLTIVYPGLLLAVTAQLRWVAGAERGYLVLASLVIATKMGDTAAYTFGRLFGKRKMAPTLSPGKTWAGFAGALFGSGLGTWAWLHFASPWLADDAPPAWFWTVGFGVIVGFVGLIGDLCESLIKRDMGQKDAAPLMPGFGGLLDLLDSILFAGPVAYVLWLCLPLAG